MLVFLLIDLRWRDSEVLKAGYWLVGRELLTTDSVKRTRYRTRQTRNSQARVDGWCAIVMISWGFGVPRAIRSSNSAHLSVKQEACSIRRVAVERKSLSSARNSSDVGLVCAIGFIMPQRSAKM